MSAQTKERDIVERLEPCPWCGEAPILVLNGQHASCLGTGKIKHVIVNQPVEIWNLRAERPEWREAIEAAAKTVEEMPMKSSDRADLMAMMLIKQCAVDRIRDLTPPAPGKGE